MALDTNFNVNPYYDDFDEDKKFLRVLFKPGKAVQSRELTQLQTILQKQVERFGNHIFKNGSVVSGGQTFLQDATFLKLDTNFTGASVNVNAFVGKTIVDNISVPTKRAEVLKVFDTDPGTGDPKTLLVKEIFGTFNDGDTITTFESDQTFANISASGTGTGQVFSVSEGVFYYDGFFLKNDAQTVATSKYSKATANARIGFEVTETLVQSFNDTSLLDPAQEASNYQAPGADRYKVDLVLSIRALDSVDDVKFIELARVEEGILTSYIQFPLYSVLEDTLARRTFDESGNYTVRPFKISLETNASNTANMDIILSPGKAYVYGYEFETISPTTITIDKPRTTDEVDNKRITADYGYFIFANTLFGTLPINSLESVDLHCVPNSTINITSTGSISNTKIGTAKIKSISFDSASDISNTATYEFKTFLFDVKTESITGQVVAANTTHITIGDTGSGDVYSTIDNAYRGARIRIASGPGVNEPPRTITSFDGTNQTVLLSEPFTATVNASSVFSIDFEFAQAKSLAAFSGTTRLAAADIDERSVDPATPFRDSFISDTNFEPLVFSLGEEFIADGTISDISLSYRRLYQTQAFSSNVSPALPVGTGESISSATSTTARAVNYLVVPTSAGSSSYEVGKPIAADLFTVNSATREITVQNSFNMTANIIATIDVSNPTPKTKTFVAGNTTIQTTGGLNLFGNNAVTLYGPFGQTHISAGHIVRVPDTPQSLHVSDVNRIISVLDFNGNAISPANAPSAINVTSRYTLDSGQRDSFYNHSSVKLRAGVPAPVGPIVVIYDQFVSSGPGFFTVDSYSGFPYENIPSYSATNGTTYQLRDSLDFRPVRANSTVATANTVVFDVSAGTTGPKIPESGSDIILDYEYFLPRIDKVVLNKSRVFEVIKGIPSLTPVEPKDKDNGMTLYVIRNPAYVANTSEIEIQYINNRRYTMRDIGAIEKRVENLEYYNTLSLLEQETFAKQDLTILDSQNLPRFKNGIIVDSFNGHSVADIFRSDYNAAIDPTRKELRPSFNISSHLLTFDPSTSTGFTRKGAFITAASTSTAFINQNKSSRFINVNPFNIVNYLGKIELEPKTDIWIDIDRRPDVLVNLEGDRDVWQLITDLIPWQYEWSSWETFWSGRSTAQNQFWQGNRLFERTTETLTEGQTRTGVASFVAPETITETIGDRVVDVSIVPYMRSRGVLFVGSDFRPNVTVFPFFDSTLVESNVARANKFTLNTNNLQFQTTVGNFETVNIVDNTTSTVNGTAVIVKTSNTEAFIVNVNPNSSFVLANASLVGVSSGQSIRINGYEHYSGIVNAATSLTVTFALDAFGANNVSEYVGSTVFVVSGPGAGQSAIISAYNPTTRTATITGSWTTTPVNGESVYSIGRLTTTNSGAVAGVFTIPTSTFRVGEKRFRLIDNNVNDVGASSTNGDATFFSQGVLQSVEDTIVSATVPSIQRATVTDERVVTSVTSVNDRFIRGGGITLGNGQGTWADPIAQTFLIDPITYPQGLFIDKVRLCFKSKDDVVPITLQLRSVTNGYPSASVVYPYGTVSLTPDKIKVTDSPNLDDADKFTEFVFDAPVYLQRGEHSLVLLANSNKYETYVAEVGALDTVSGRQISDQPYQGSFFLSQNGSTWTAEQNLDLMFRLFKSTFSAAPTIAQFRVDAPSANTAYDLLHLIVGDLNIATTTLNYQFNSIIDSTGAAAGFKSITPQEDYEMKDGLGRRVLTTSNNSLILRATMSTTNPDVSPVIDTTRVGTIVVENIINNLPLREEDLVIVSGGSGYANSADVAVTITGGNGSGATATANVVANTIDQIFITDPGAGFTTSPTFTITSGSGGGSGAVVLYNGEDKKSGGNADVRYITRRVTLADGFDSGDLRVYLTAYKPSGSNIHVYYKLLSKSDPDAFTDKNYQLMTQLGNPNFVSTGDFDYRELKFAPGQNGVPDNSVSYVSDDGTSHSSFRTFAIKVVLRGTSTVDVPKVKDVRVIALPTGN
jgi:hypothetical protein